MSFDHKVGLKIIVKTVHFAPESTVQFKPEWGVHFAPESPVQFESEWGVQFASEYPVEERLSLNLLIITELT